MNCLQTGIELQMQKTNSWLPGGTVEGRRRGKRADGD